MCQCADPDRPQQILVDFVASRGEGDRVRRGVRRVRIEPFVAGGEASHVRHDLLVLSDPMDRCIGGAAHALSSSDWNASGSEVGDEIREVAGDRVRSFEELRVSLEAIDSDTEYEIEVVRDGDERTLTARRGEGFGGDLTALLQRFADGGLDLENFDLENFDGFDLRDFLDGLDGEEFDFERFAEGFDLDGFDFERFMEELDDGDFDLERALDDFRFDLQTDRFGPTPGDGSLVIPRFTGPLGVTVEQAGEGVIVAAVASGSIAEIAGFQPGDVILGLGGDRIRTVDQLRAAWDASSSPGSAGPVLVEIERGGHPRVLVVFPVAVPARRNPMLPLPTATPYLRAQEFQ